MKRENDETREIENEVVETLRPIWKFDRAERQQDWCPLDFALFRYRDEDWPWIWSFLEVRSINLAFGNGPYGGVYVPLDKVIYAVNVHQLSDRACRLAVKLSDGTIISCSMLSYQPGCLWEGREDRGKPEYKPHILFAWKTFKTEFNPAEGAGP